MTANFVFNTRAEFLKTKRTAAIWLTVAAALFVMVVNFISMMAEPKHFLSGTQENPWANMIDSTWTIGAVFVLPMFVILVTSMVVQTEYRNNTWKQVYASPRSYADVFFSKLLVIHALILLCFLLFNAAIIMFSYLAMVFNSGYQIFTQPIPWLKMFTLLAKAYFGILTLSTIQYWLTLRIRNFIVPMGIGLALLITGIIIHSWDKLYYFPYMYPAIFCMRDYASKVTLIQKAEMYNLVWFALVLGLSFLDTAKRKERG
jgi:lantibiotic transport system permease protein